MAAVSPDFFRELDRMIQQLSNRQEQYRNVIITDEARKFLSVVIVESAIYRGSEWQQKQQIDVGDPNDLMRVVDIAKDRIVGLLDDAKSVRAASASYICVVSLVEAIHDRWCGVWPFCR